MAGEHGIPDCFYLASPNTIIESMPGNLIEITVDTIGTLNKSAQVIRASSTLFDMVNHNTATTT